MKYKGITLFSAALILMGSVGTATGYIADRPTEVSAASTDTLISKLLGDSKTTLSKLLSVNTKSATKVDEQSTTAKIKMYKATTDSTGKSVPTSELSAANKYFSVDPTVDNADEHSTITQNSDGTYNVALKITIPSGLNKDAVTINSINGKTISANDVTESGNDTDGYTMDFSFNVSSLNELKNPIPINMSMKIILFPGMDPIKVTADAFMETDTADITKAEELFKKADPTPTPDSTVTDKITAADADLTDLSTAKDTLDTASTALDTQLTALKAKLAELKNAAGTSDATKTIIDNVTSKISSLQATKAQIDKLISQLKTKIAAIKSDLSDLKAAKDAATEAEINKIQSAIDTAKTAKDTIDSKITTLKSGISAMSTTIQQAIADANAKTPVTVADNTGTTTDDTIADEYKVPYVVNKTGTSTASASSQYFTKTAFVTPNDDGTFNVEVQMEYPLSYGADAVKIDAVNGTDVDQNTVTTTSDDSTYLTSFKFNVDSLSDLNSVIPVKMTMNIAGGLFSGTESADLVFDTTNLPITNPSNNTNTQVAGTPTSTAATSGTTLGTSSSTLPQTDAKSLPVYIMYAGFILLAVTLAGAGKARFTGKK
ncbi:coiled-coil domain-containing protein [Companilactobacillus jidongensis]|uniref:coiled-coil domain-containing protein n=1 Tax=Companilactobacillus jidongensis TaxID=2486006 RepID=UPI000F7B83C7|nr:hypothetical protein [Companilactobacillus jidongensis]